jgi:hypothetical protein
MPGGLEAQPKGHAFLDSQLKYGNGTEDRPANPILHHPPAACKWRTGIHLRSLHTSEPITAQADARIPRCFVDTNPSLIYLEGIEHRIINLDASVPWTWRPRCSACGDTQGAHPVS